MKKLGRLLDEQGVPEKLQMPHEAILEVMEDCYGGYFSPDVKDRVFNPDMVLYFTHKALTESGLPRAMIDHNARIDYEKLRHLILADLSISAQVST